MPEPAPVMAATRPLKSFIVFPSSVSGADGLERSSPAIIEPENSMMESSMSLIFSAR